MHSPYDHIAEQWHSNRRGPLYANKVLAYVDKLLDGLPPGARVLDLGCGAGHPIAIHVAARGLNITGIDQSEKMLEYAKLDVPEGTFIHGDMVDLSFGENFAAAIAWDSIFHVKREFHLEIYRKLATALAPGGRLLTSVGGSDPEDFDKDVDPNDTRHAEGFTSEMYGHTFFYSGYEPAVARGLLEDVGFEIDLWEVDDPSSHGHIAVIAKKVR